MTNAGTMHVNPTQNKAKTMHVKNFKSIPLFEHLLLLLCKVHKNVSVFQIKGNYNKSIFTAFKAIFNSPADLFLLAKMPRIFLLTTSTTWLQTCVPEHCEGCLKQRHSFVWKCIIRAGLFLASSPWWLFGHFHPTYNLVKLNYAWIAIS